MFGGGEFLFFVLWVVVGVFFEHVCMPMRIWGHRYKTYRPKCPARPLCLGNYGRWSWKAVFGRLFPKGRVRGPSVCPAGAAAARSPQAARPCPRRAPFSDIPQAGAAISCPSRGCDPAAPLRAVGSLKLTSPSRNLWRGKSGFYTPPSPRVKEGLPHGKGLCRAVWARCGLSSGGFPKGFVKRPVSKRSKTCPPHKQQNLNTQTFLF